MTNRACAIGAATVLAVVCFALQSQIATWSDNAGNMKVENWTSWRITKTGESTYSFKGSGSPFKGTWKEQGLAVRAKTVEGTTKRDAKGSMRLTTATITGIVDATLTETDAKGNSRTTDLDTQTIVFDGADNQVTIPGAVTVTNRSPSEGQTMVLKGSSAKLILPEVGVKSEWPAKSGTVSGPVTFRLDALSRSEKEDEKPRKITVTGTAGRVTFDESSREIVLSGGVHMEGDDSLIGGNVRCARAVITLDEKREIAGIDLTGDPGISELRDSKGGGSR